MHVWKSLMNNEIDNNVFTLFCFTVVSVWYSVRIIVSVRIMVCETSFVSSALQGKRIFF